MDKETSSGRSEVDNSIKKSILCTGDRTKISGIGCVGSARQPLFPISETVMNAYTSTKNLDSEFYRSRSKSEQGSLRKGGHRFRDLYKVSCCEKFQHNSSRVSAARSSSSKAFSSQQFCAYAVKDELKGQMRESEKISQHSKLLELDDRGDLFQCGNAKADIEISVDFASGDVEEEAASETSGTSSGPESERDVSSYETSGILCCAPTAIDCGNPSSSRNALIAKLDQMTAPSMSHTQAVKRVLSQVQDGYPSRQRPNSKELEPVLHHEIQLFSRTRHVRKSKAEQIHAPDGSNFRPPFHHDIDGAIPQVKNFPGATMVSEKFLSSWIKIMSPGGLDHKYLTTRSWLPCGASQKSQTYPKIEVGSDQFQKKYWGTNKSRCAAGKSHAKEPLNNIAASVFGSAVSGSTLKTALWHLPAMNLSKSELGPEATRAAKDWGVRMTTQEKLGSPEAQAFECHGYLTPMCRPPAQHSRPKFQWSPEGSLFSRKLEMDVQSSEQCPGDNNQTSNEDRDLLCRFSSDCVSPSEVEKWKDVEQLVREQKLQNEELRAQIRAKDRAIDAARTEAEMGFTILKDAELNLDRMRRENRRLTESLVENGKVVSSISFECENAKEEIRKQELRRKGCEVELQKMEVILTNCGIKMQNVEHERRIEGRALAGALKLASNTEQSKNDTLVETSLGGDRFGGVEKSDNSPVRAFTMGDRHEELEHFWITENQQSSIEKVMLLQTLSQNLKRKVVQLHGEIKVMKGMITDEGDKLFGRNGRKLTDAQGKQIVISACKESDYSAKNAGFSIFKPQMGQRKGQIPGCRRKVAMLSSEHDRTDVLLQVFDTRVSESSTTWPMKVGTEGATFESDDAPENIVDLIPRPSQIGRVCNFIKNDTRDSRPVLCLADQSESCFPQHAQLIDKRGPQKINGQDVCQGEVQQYQFQQRRYDQFLQFDQLQVNFVGDTLTSTIATCAAMLAEILDEFVHVEDLGSLQIAGEQHHRLKSKFMEMRMDVLDFQGAALDVLRVWREGKLLTRLDGERLVSASQISGFQDLRLMSSGHEDDCEQKEYSVDLLKQQFMRKEQNLSFFGKTFNCHTRDPNLDLGRKEQEAELLVLREQLALAQSLAHQSRTAATEARQVAEWSSSHAEEKEEEARILGQSVEELESTVHLLQSQLDIVNREVEKQHFEKETLETELDAVNHHLTLMREKMDYQEAESRTALRNAETAKTELDRVVIEINNQQIQARKAVESLQQECADKDLQLKTCKAHITDLMFGAEKQALESQRKLKALESMVEQLKAEERRVSTTVSVGRVVEKFTAKKVKGGGSAFKCIGSALIQHRSSALDEELSAAKKRIEELETIAASRQKEVFMLNTRLAEAENMTHDVVRDLLGVKTDIASYASLLNQQQVQHTSKGAKVYKVEPQQRIPTGYQSVHEASMSKPDVFPDGGVECVGQHEFIFVSN